MLKNSSFILICLLIIVLSNCTPYPYPLYTVSFSESIKGKSQSNRFSTVDGSRVFYSEGQEYPGVYFSYSDSNKQNISGTGTIKVLVKMVSEDNFEEFGIEYGDGYESYPYKEIRFYIKRNGTYTIYWLDNANSSSVSWISSPYIKTELNEWNELRIDYDTTNKTFSFYINDSPKLLERTFNYIGAGIVSYYTSLHNANTTFPYRIEFKTTSPYTYP